MTWIGIDYSITNEGCSGYCSYIRVLSQFREPIRITYGLSPWQEKLSIATQCRFLIIGNINLQGHVARISDDVSPNNNATHIHQWSERRVCVFTVRELLNDDAGLAPK